MNYGFIFILAFIMVSIPLSLVTFLPFFGFEINLEELNELADEMEIPFFPNWILDFLSFIEGIPFIGQALITPILTFTLYPFFYLIHLVPWIAIILIPSYIGVTVVFIWKLIDLLWIG